MRIAAQPTRMSRAVAVGRREARAGRAGRGGGCGGRMVRGPALVPCMARVRLCCMHLGGRAACGVRHVLQLGECACQGVRSDASRGGNGRRRRAGAGAWHAEGQRAVRSESREGCGGVSRGWRTGCRGAARVGAQALEAPRRRVVGAPQSTTMRRRRVTRSLAGRGGGVGQGQAQGRTGWRAARGRVWARGAGAWRGVGAAGAGHGGW